MIKSMRILILGSGFAGVGAVLQLLKQLPADTEITLVGKSHYHCYIPDLYDVATARLKNPDVEGFNNLKASVDLHLNDIFKNKKVSIVTGEVTAVNLPEKIVTLTNQTLTYDYLVIALGSTTAYFGIAGAGEYSHPLKSAEDAIRIRNDLGQLVKSARASSRKIRVAIGGGGFTGVELAGAMSSLLGKNSAVTIVEAGKQILGGMPDWAKGDALKKLQKLQVEVKLNFPVKIVTEKEIISANGQRIPYDYLIWTAGVVGAVPDQGIKGVVLGKKNQIPVLDDLSVNGFPEVFAIGDCAQIGNPKKGFVPQTAWAAIAEAETAAANIIRKIKRRQTKPFIPPPNQFVVPVGEVYGLSNVFGFKTKGVLAWILKELIALKYLASICGPLKALNVWRKEVTVDLMDH